VALAAAPVLLAAGVAVHPDDAHGVERTMEAIDSSWTWTFTHLVEPYAWALLGIALLLALPRMAGPTGRGRRLLGTAAWMCAVGYVSLGFIVYGHGEAYRHMAATDVEPAAYTELFDRFNEAIPLAALPSLLGRLGLLLAVIGLVRARTVPVWAAALLMGPVALMGAGGMLPMAVGLSLFFGPLVVGCAVLARRVARTGGPALGIR
jgi:hypothetical protein